MALAVLFVAGHPGSPPLEDAAILMRYSRNVADGHGIVWNVGSPPVDGATDFLFMISAGALTWLGLSVETAVRSLSVVGHAATVALIYFGSRTLVRATRPVALIAAAFIAIGPAVRYVDAGFGTTFFAMTVTGTWLLLLRYRNDPRDQTTATLFALSAFVLGLTRPEGVLLALLMVAGLVASDGPRATKRLLFTLVAVMGTLGMIYFLWRWWYFGYPLPNPYYKKGGGNLHVDGLRSSVRELLKIARPVLILFAAAVLTRRGRRNLLLYAIPIGGFCAVWLLLSSEMNFLGRFQYPIEPIVAMAIPTLWPSLFGSSTPSSWSARGRRVAQVPLAAILLIAPLHVMVTTSAQRPDGLRDIGLRLAQFGSEGHSMAVTEAGLLPLYSRWIAFDTWGLNDQWIAHNGEEHVDAYLAQLHPDLIAMHAPLCFTAEAAAAPASYWLQGWFVMTNQLCAFVRQNGYIFVVAFGSREEAVAYYLDPNTRDAPGIEAAIRNAPNNAPAVSP